MLKYFIALLLAVPSLAVTETITCPEGPLLGLEVETSDPLLGSERVISIRAVCEISEPPPPPPPPPDPDPEPEFGTCFDGIDNDNDGLIDREERESGDCTSKNDAEDTPFIPMPDPEPVPEPEPDPDPDPNPQPDPDPLPPGSRMGIPERPFENVATGSATVQTGAAQCIGTPDQPAFMVGGSVDDEKWVLQAEYCIVDGVTVTGKMQVTGLMAEFRNMDNGHGDGAGVRLNGSDLAYINSESHHHRGNNGHGVLVTCNSQRVWVGGNTFKYNDEDGLQSGHGCQGQESDEIYFYNNVCVNNRENCSDYKWVKRVVESGNIARDHRQAAKNTAMTYDDGSTGHVVNSGSDGTGLVVGSDGSPQTVFIFGNVYEDNAGCLRVEDATDVYILGMECRRSNFGTKYDKSGTTRLADSMFEDAGFMLSTTWRDGIHVSEINNARINTEYRDGNAGTVDNNTSRQDIIDAYQAAFGRAP